MTAAVPSEKVRLAEPRGRWVLLATVLGSGIAALDATVVNIALPAIGADLDAGFAGLQWTVNAYTLALASFILLGGSLGDRFGRRRVFVIGVVWFAVASALCAAAPSVEFLVAARALQGVGGALLTPGSLAMISASFTESDRSRAIGAWSGLGGIAGAIGPFLGGYLVGGPGWRWIFLINLPVAALVVWIAAEHVPETYDPAAAPRLDLLGAAAGAIGLGGLTYALIGLGDGWSALVVAIGAIGVLGIVGFLVVERRSPHPMLPLGLFTVRQFSAANVVTFVVYAALGGVMFLLVITLQVAGGMTPLLAGAALLPVTVVMLAGSASAGALAGRIGPRLPMSIGPLIAAAGVLLLLRISPAASYLTEVLPAAVVFGCGLTVMVAPLTTSVLAAAPTDKAGIASGVNNAVARTAGMLAVAVLPVLAGISGGGYSEPAELLDGFRVAMVICAGLLLIGGALAAALIRNPAAVEVPEPDRRTACAIDGPPVEARATDDGSAPVE